MKYRQAPQEFDRFLTDVAAETGLTARNQAYTTTEDAIAFAQILPVMLRALFVQDRDIAEPRPYNWGRDVMTAEV